MLLAPGQAAISIRVHEICLAALLFLGLMASSANEILVSGGRPRSVLIIDQSTSFRPWPTAIVARNAIGLRGQSRTAHRNLCGAS
jgi:hypothetical protein